MKTIIELASMGEHVYVHLKDEATAQRFLQQAETEGFAFSDGVKPTERHWSDLYAIHPDGTLSYVTTNGRIHYASVEADLVRIDYADLLRNN